MRPLSRPFLSAQAAALHSPHALLMNALGHFCAFCERPLLAESWVWNARTGEILDETPIDPSDWEELYLLDHNCCEAQRHSAITDFSTLLLPNRPDAFNPLNPDSPITYSMERLTRVIIDEEGNEVGPPESIDRVVVSGRTGAARATIAHFALNTAYYRKEEKRLVIPQVDFLSLEDRRMDQRTQAWERTVEIARKVSLGNRGEISDALKEQLRLLVGAMGYWSSCVTAASQVLDERKDLRRIFLDPAERAPTTPTLAADIAGMQAEQDVTFNGNGPHHTFPGTYNIFGD